MLFWKQSAIWPKFARKKKLSSLKVTQRLSAIGWVNWRPVSTIDHLVHPPAPTIYVALPMKSWMRSSKVGCRSPIQWTHWKTAQCCESEKCTAFKALQELWKSLINTTKWNYWLLFPVSDWLDSFFGPVGLLLVVSHLP